MKTRPTVRILLSAALCLSASRGALALHQLEGETLRFYGASSKPCLEIELREMDGSGDSPIPEDGPCWVSLNFLTPDRSRLAHTTGLPLDGSFFVQRPNERGFDVSGRLPVEGKDHAFRARLSTDRRKFEWIEPAAVTLADGRTFQLAGTYAEWADAARNAAARSAFDKLDAAMLDAFTRVKQALGEGGFAKVQAGQRKWLKYRDRPVRANYDGDIAQNGPGSATHYRILSRETAFRTAYLRSILDTAGRGRARRALPGRHRPRGARPVRGRRARVHARDRLPAAARRGNLRLARVDHRLCREGRREHLDRRSKGDRGR